MWIEVLKWGFLLEQDFFLQFKVDIFSSSGDNVFAAACWPPLSRGAINKVGYIILPITLVSLRVSYNIVRPAGDGPGLQGAGLPPNGFPRLATPPCGDSRLAARQRLDSTNGKVGDQEGECACTRCKEIINKFLTFCCTWLKDCSSFQNLINVFLQKVQIIKNCQTFLIFYLYFFCTRLI